MVAKLAFFLLIIAGLVAVGMAMVFMYFNQHDEREWKKDMYDKMHEYRNGDNK